MTNLALVIEWKLTQLDAFKGAKVNTENNELTRFEVDGFVYPSEETLEIWKAEYEVEMSKPKSDKTYNLEDLVKELRKNGYID